MDYKLVRFFCSACVTRTHVDEFFRNSFPSIGSDASYVTFSYHSAYTLYKIIDEMVMDLQWKNLFVDFKLANNTDFWYRDIMSILKYLLRWKSFASHIVWCHEPS